MGYFFVLSFLDIKYVIILKKIKLKQTMDTLKISQVLQTAGLERKPAEAIAKVIESKNQELATKQDLKLLATVLIGIMAAGFGYIISTQNTIINAVVALAK